jgi:hypothetical protein
MKIANIELQSLWFHSFVICNVRIAETWHLQVIRAVVSKKKNKVTGPLPHCWAAQHSAHDE